MSTQRIIYNILLMDDNDEQLEIISGELNRIAFHEDRYEMRVSTVTKSTEVIEEAKDCDFDVYILDVARKANHKWQTGKYDYYGLDLYRLLLKEKPNMLVKSRFFIYSKLPKDAVKKEFGNAAIDFYRKQDTSPAQMAQLVKDYIDSLYAKTFTNTFSTENRKPKTVFVTYAWKPSNKEAVKYAEEVLAFVNKLRANNYNASFDLELFEKYDNWHTTMIEGLKMDKIVVLLSKEYKAKADYYSDKHGTGVEFESSVITQIINKDPTRVQLVKLESMRDIPNEDIIPICYNTGKNVIDLSETGTLVGYNRLFARLSDRTIVDTNPISGDDPTIQKLNPFE